MANTNSIASQIVAVAWVRGSITNLMVVAISGRQPSACGGQIAYLVNRGDLEKVPNCGYPGSWRLTAERAKTIDMLPDQDSLRTQAEQVAQRMDQVLAIREATRPERMARRNIALPGSRPARPGRDLVVPTPAGMSAPVVVAAPRVSWADIVVQNPHGHLCPSTTTLAAAADTLRLRGGLLAPADGPYIRPGARAADAVPSRRGDALVPHRPPLSQP